MAKAIKPRTVGEELTLATVEETVNIMLAEKACKVMNTVSLSNDTVQG
jgi:hypothetical protein